MPVDRLKVGRIGMLVAFAFFLVGTILAVVDIGDPAASYRDLVWTLFALGFLFWLGANIYARRGIPKDR